MHLIFTKKNLIASNFPIVITQITLSQIYEQYDNQQLQCSFKT